MKLFETLNSRDPVWYSAGYDSNGGFDEWKTEVMSGESFRDVIAAVVDDFGSENAHQLSSSVWYNWALTEPEIEPDYDEDGPSLYTRIAADVNIVTRRPLQPAEAQKLFEMVQKQVEASAEQAVEDELEAQRDDAEYNRDPYAYYGVRRSDF